jgi:hypothetical protein
MKIFAIVITVALAAIGAYTARGLLRTTDLGLYYPPTLFLQSQHCSISIHVEIDKKGNKESFVKLFNIYGFSGNGPSIEQVVKANIKTKKLVYDSEGDTFLIHAPDQETYLRVLKELEAITRIELLNVWLRNTAWILIKE